MMWWITGNDGQNWWILHAAAMALFWVTLVLIIGIIALRPRSQAAERGNGDNGGILSARTILEERYAKGEIGREEFLNKMRDLDVRVFDSDATAQIRHR